MRILICNLLAGVFLAAALFFCASPMLAQSEQRVVRVGIYDNPPKIYTDEEGVVTGLYGDLLAFIAEQENWRLEYIPGTFEEGLTRVLNGEIDIMVDVAISKDRQVLYDFNNENFINSWGVIYTQKNSSINSFSDLNGKKIAVLLSSVYDNPHEDFHLYAEAFNLQNDLIELDEYDKIFKQLSEGAIDAAVVSRISGLEAENKYPNIKATNIIFSPTELRLAFTKNDIDNPYLISRIDFWMKRLKGGYNGIYQKTLAKHKLSTGTVEIVPQWVFRFGLIGIAALLFSWISAVLFKRAMERTKVKLKTSEMKFSTIVNSMEEGVVLQKENGEIVTVNLAVDKILGFDGRELVGQNLKDVLKNIKVIHEDGSDMHEEEHPALVALRTGQPQRNTVLGVTKPDGNLVWISINTFPLLTEHSHKPYAAVTTFRDVTDQRNLEEHRKELDELKTKFIHIIAHQFRTPLGVIRWNTETVLGNLPNETPKQVRDLISAIYTQDIKIISRIAELLIVVRIEENRLKITKSPVDIASLVREACQEKSAVAQEKGLTYSIAADKNLSFNTNTDAPKVKDVVERLIDNAIIYTPSGGKIDINFYIKDNLLKFEISDNGIGISAEELPKVFDKFFRGKEAILVEPNSFGLGLYFAKNYIERLGGKIGVNSEEHKGSTFWFELPM